MPKQKKKTVLISAGDPSADQHAAKLIQQLTDIRFIGMGGKEMQAVGLHCLVDASNLAVIGITEVISKYFSIRRAMKTLVNILKNQKPDLLLCVDYAAFNLRLAKVAKRRGIPVLYYISPQVWASRSYRVRTIKRTVDEMAVIFPFEKAFYQAKNFPVHYVGNPVLARLQQMPAATPKTASHTRYIGLLPGSRPNEINRLLPIILQAAKQLSKRYPNAEFILPKANNIPYSLLAQHTQAVPSLPLRIVENALYPSIRACDAIIATSGTVTLEVGLLGKPFVLIYKVNRLTAWIAKRIIAQPYIGICNIIAGKQIIPELLQENCQPHLIVQAICKILDDQQYRDTMVAELQSVKNKLDASQADTTLDTLVTKMLSGT